MSLIALVTKPAAQVWLRVCTSRKHVPERDAPHEEVPEEVEDLQEHQRHEHLVLHPPYQPDAIFRRPPLGGFAVEQCKVIMMPTVIFEIDLRTA